MPATLAVADENDLGDYAQAVPAPESTAPVDDSLGDYAQAVPPDNSTAAYVAPEEDFGDYAEAIPKTPTHEAEKALAETPTVPSNPLLPSGSATGALIGASVGAQQATEEVPPQVQDIFAQSIAQQKIERNAPGTAPDWMQNAAAAAAETVSDFVPKSASEVVQFLTPAAGAIDEVKKTYGLARDVVAGKPLEEAERANFPESFALVDAEKTPAFSKERFKAGFGVLAQMGMLAAGGRGLAKAGAEPAAAAETSNVQRSTSNAEVEPQSLETKLPVTSEAPPDLIAAAEDKPGASSEAAATTFEPSTEWQEVPVGTTVPSGGEYRMDMATQKSYARWAPENLPTEPSGLEGGPGAASSREKLASYELRRFGTRFQETEGISSEIRSETGNRYYEPIPNKITVADAGKIIDERGTDEAVRLVRDETFAMEPRVRATLAQELIQKLNKSHAEATAANDAPRAQSFLNQAVDTAEYLSEYGTRLGQGVQSFAIWSRLTPEGMLESARRSAKRAGIELTPEQATEIARLTQDAHDAPEGIPKQDAMRKLASYMADKTGIPARDLPIAMYYTHILSGVQTHIVNTVDTALNVWHEANNMALSNPRATAAIYGGLMRGIGEGKYDALMALSEGRRITSGKFVESPDILDVSRFGQKGGVPIAETGKISKTTRRIVESRFAKPLNAYKYVMRMMNASDSVAFRGAEEARAGLLAFKMAEARGVQERAAIQKEIGSILGYDRLPEFRKQAESEGYSGAKGEARATELMIQSRPDEIRADASDFAGVATYNHEPKGMLGYFANAVGQASNKYPVLKLFVPFTRIVANVTNRGLDNTPIGIYRALRGGKKALEGEAKQQALTRAIAGTAGLAGMGVLNASGIIQVHGAGPSDTERKRQLRAAGWKPFTVQVGDHYFTYTYTPIGLGMSVLGNYLDSNRYNELSQKDAQTRLAYSISRIGSTVFSQSFLSGLSNLFEILSGDPGKSITSLKQFFSSVVTSATTPNLIRDVNGIFDPVTRKSENIAQDLVRNIPVIRLSLKPTLNAYGEPVILSRNRFFSSRNDDPAWRVVVDKNLRVPVADQTTFESPDDGYEYARISGERMKKYVVSHISRLESASNEKAQDMLTKASRNIFDDARVKIAHQGGKRRKKK